MQLRAKYGQGHSWKLEHKAKRAGSPRHDGLAPIPRDRIDVGSPVPPESPPMKPGGGNVSRYNITKVTKVAENQNG